MQKEHAVSPVISVALMLGIVVICAVIVMSTVSGMTPFSQKSAFIATEIDNPVISRNDIITVYSWGGDTRYLNLTSLQGKEISVNIDTLSGSYRARPVTGCDVFCPWTTLYVFRNSGMYLITKNRDDFSSTAGTQSIKAGPVTVRLVDENAQVLVAEWSRDSGGLGSGLTTVILSDNLNSIFSGWTTSGTVNWYSGEPKSGSYSVQLRGNSGIKRIISTVGYNAITASFAMGASSSYNTGEMRALWSSDGLSWTVLKIIKYGSSEEDNYLHDYAISLPAGASNNPSFALWFWNTGTHSGNKGDIYNVIVRGTPM